MLVGADRISAQPIPSPKPATTADGAQATSSGLVVEPIRYHNPVFSIDSSGVVVVQVRDTDTGEIKQQFPSEKVLKAYRQQAAAGPAQVREVDASEPAAAAPAETAAAAEPADAGAAADAAQTAAGLRLDV